MPYSPPPPQKKTFSIYRINPPPGPDPQTPGASSSTLLACVRCSLSAQGASVRTRALTYCAMVVGCLQRSGNLVLYNLSLVGWLVGTVLYDIVLCTASRFPRAGLGVRDTLCSVIIISFSNNNSSVRKVLLIYPSGNSARPL